MEIKKIFSAFLIASSIALTISACAPTPTSTSTGGYIDDSVITTKVKAKLLNAPNLSSTEIKVKTFKGTVQLSGFVSSKGDIDKAVELTQNVPGVIKVINDMQLK